MTTEQESKQGIPLAVAAYTMWETALIYFKAISQVRPLETLSHRIVWLFIFLAVLLHLGRRWRGPRDICRLKNKMLSLISTALLVEVNWLIYIWTVNANRMLDASLGYYINPLLNVMLGLVFLDERLRNLQ